MLQPRSIVARLFADAARRWQGTPALVRGCAERVLRAGTHTRIASVGVRWRHSSSHGGGPSDPSSLLFALARTVTLALLLVVGGSGVSVPGTMASLAPHARAGGSPPPLLLVASLTSTSSPHQTQATLLSLRSPRFRYQRGYSIQRGWLCLGFANGTLHCTAHWQRSGGRYVSLNPGWVPSEGAAAPTPVSSHVSSQSSPAPAHLSQWASTGHASYPEPRGTFQGYAWGWCTSGAAMLAHDNVRGLGNARDWARNAAARGMRVTSTPHTGATVVFQPGVQGAGGGGHVAHVIAVYSGGWFLVAEVNFTWNGGGWGRVSYRYAHAGVGVSFIL